VKSRRISVGVLERDKADAEALSDALLEFFPNELTLSLLASQDQAVAWTRRGRPGVLLVDQDRLAQFPPLPPTVAVAALVDLDEDAPEGVATVSRYLAVDTIYQEIVRLHAALEGGPSGDGVRRRSTVVAFTSPKGGVGATAVALAFARKLARAVTDKVLYLDLTPFAAAGELLDGRGSGTMTDVVFAAKSSSPNLATALVDRALRDEATGLFYYASARTAADLMELTAEELARVYQIALSGVDFKYVVLDQPFAWSGPHADALGRADQVIAVTDSSPGSNYKLVRAVEALDLRAGGVPGGSAWTVQAVFYNQSDAKELSKVDLPDLVEIGRAGRFTGLTEAQVVQRLEQSPAFDALLDRTVARS
jgi:MinD-like ATPase involved in chromosome partitioning or flagellar assembly